MSQNSVGARTDSAEKGLSIAQNMAWNSVGNIVYLGAQWTLSFAVVRILGYGDTGIFSLAMSVGNSVCALAAYSMRNYQASDVDGTFSDQQYVLSRVVTSVISLLATIVFVLLQPYSVETALCVVAYSIFKISEAFSDVYQAIQQKHLRMDYVGKAYFLKSTIELALFCATLLLTHSLVPAVTVLGIASFSEIFLYERRVSLRLAGESYGQSNNTDGSNQWRMVTRLLIACAPMAIYGVLFNTFTQVPRYYLESLCGAETLGIYAAVAMPVTLVQIAANYLFTPLTTPMAQLYKAGDHKKLLLMFMRVTASILAVSALAFVVAALVGEPVYVLMYGESIRENLYLVNPLIVCSAITALSWFFSNTITVLRRLRTLLVGSILAFGVSLVVSGPLIERFGMNGTSFACIASLLAFVLVMIVGLMSARSSFSE